MAVATAILMVPRSRSLFGSERAVAAIVAELVRHVPSCVACDEPDGAGCSAAVLLVFLPPTLLLII